MISYFVAICLVVFTLCIILVYIFGVNDVLIKEFRRLKEVLINYNSLILVCLILVAFILLLTILLNKSQSFNSALELISNDGEGYGQIGDLFNGLITPILTIISILFLYRAFKQQFRANDLIQAFELERSFKQDLQLIKKQAKVCSTVLEVIKKKSNTELAIYLEPNSNSEIKDLILIINQFWRMLERTENELGNSIVIDKQLVMLKEEIWQMMSLYYLSNLKDIYRRLGSFELKKRNDIEISDVKNLLHEKYIKEFAKMYPLIMEMETDTGFKSTFINIRREF